MAAKPTFFFPPNFNYPPEGPLRLGQLITAIDDPGTPVGSTGPESLIKHNVEVWRNEQTVKTHGYSTTSTTTASLFIKAVQAMVGLQAGLNWSQQHSANILSHIEKLDIQFIQPSNKYVEDSIWKPDVQVKLKGWFWNKRVFMITGLCTAYPAEDSQDSVTQWSEQDRSAGGDISATGPAGTGSAGGGVSFNIPESQSYILDIIPKKPFVYAFQLRTCRYGKRRASHRPYTDGAKFTEESRSSERQTKIQEESPDDYEFVWNEFADEDLSLEELGLDGKGLRLEEAVDEVTGSQCNYIVPAKLSV